MLCVRMLWCRRIDRPVMCLWTGRARRSELLYWDSDSVLGLAVARGWTGAALTRPVVFSCTFDLLASLSRGITTPYSTHERSAS